MNSLTGGQRPGAFGDLENRLSEEEKKMLQEFIREEIEKNKQQAGVLQIRDRYGDPNVTGGRMI